MAYFYRLIYFIFIFLICYPLLSFAAISPSSQNLYYLSNNYNYNGLSPGIACQAYAAALGSNYIFKSATASNCVLHNILAPPDVNTNNSMGSRLINTCPLNSTGSSSCVCDSGYVENSDHSVCVVLPAPVAPCPVSQSASATIALGWFPVGSDGFTLPGVSVLDASYKTICVQNGSNLCSANVSSSVAIGGAFSNGSRSWTAQVSGPLTGATCPGPVTPSVVTDAPPPCTNQLGTVNGISVCVASESQASKDSRASTAASTAAVAASSAATAAGASPAQAEAAGAAAGAAAASAIRSGASIAIAASAGAAAGSAASAAAAAGVPSAAAGSAAGSASAAAAAANAAALAAGLTPAQALAVSNAALAAASAASLAAAASGKSVIDQAAAASAAANAASAAAFATAKTAAVNAAAAAAASGKSAADAVAAGQAALNAALASAATSAAAAKAALDGAAAALAKSASDAVTKDPISDFCTKNPKAAMCKEAVDSTFSGACGSPPACTGDAVMCATAAASFKSACVLSPDANAESDLYDVEKVKTGNRNSEIADQNPITISPSSFNASNLFGAGTCIPDRTIVVGGHSVSIPFSSICVYLVMLGQLLVGISFLLAGRIVVRG